MDESIEKSGSLFYGLNSPTLKVASSNLVSRTKNEDFLWKILVFAYEKLNYHSNQIAVNSSAGNSAEGYRRGGVSALLYA